MTETGRDAVAQEPVDRRHILAGAAALAGAAIAKLASPDDARAGHNTSIAYDTDTVVHTDVTNTTAGSTRISSNISGTAAFVGLNNYPVGISRPDGILGRTSYTTSNCAGVAGSCEAANGGIGVMGTADAADGVGVYGFAGSNVPSEVGPQGSGVYGVGPNRGVSGKSANGVGLYGYSGPNASDVGPVAATGIFGRALNGIGTQGHSATGHGVRGVSSGTVAAVRGEALATGVGVEGLASATGVRGESTAGTGVQGASTGGTGVQGTTETGTAVHGVATGSGVAGRFTGRTVVDGVLETTGATPVALVKGSDGSSQRTYPHAGLAPSFEHVGEAKLKRGRATVKLPAGLDLLVTGKRYQVFLTEYGNSGGLYVTARGEHAFKVRSRRPRSNGRFGYRIVAVRSDLKS
jgi:hypothetical protein